MLFDNLVLNPHLLKSQRTREAAMMSDWKRYANLPGLAFSMASLVAVAGCGGGGSEEAATAETPAPKAEAGKSATPTVKGLGAAAKDRQEGIDSGASGAPAGTESAGGPPTTGNPGTDAMRKQMMQAQAGQGGPPGGAKAESEGPPATGSGAAAPGSLTADGPAGGGYVPPNVAQGGPGSAGGPPGGPPGGGPGGGGYVPPGVNSGGPPGGGAGMPFMPPGGYGGPGGRGGFGGGGGAGNAVLLAENAFTENGEALTEASGGTGAAGGALKADFTDPLKTVETFLAATKARDAELISESLSRRAPEEAKKAALKKFMTSAREKTLESQGLDDLATAFADYKVEKMSVAKTSGSVNVVIGRVKKTNERDRSDYERRIMRVHRDGKAGWKIVEFGDRIKAE